MKLSMKIEGEKFEYDYEVGTSSGHGDMPFGADHLSLFSDILKMCYRCHSNKHDLKMREIEALAYIEEHPDVLKKVGKSNG